jgi:hypothetical protein
MAGMDRQISRDRRRRERALTKAVARIMKLKRELESDWLDAVEVLRDCVSVDDINLWMAVTSGFRVALSALEVADETLSPRPSTEKEQ